MVAARWLQPSGRSVYQMGAWRLEMSPYMARQSPESGDAPGSARRTLLAAALRGVNHWSYATISRLLSMSTTHSERCRQHEQMMFDTCYTVTPVWPGSTWT
jgi:hypothetical protein